MEIQINGERKKPLPLSSDSHSNSLCYTDTEFFLSVLQEANGCDDEIQDLRGHQVELSQQLEDKQVNVQHLQSQSDTLDGDIERLFENKQKVNHPGINMVPASHFDEEIVGLMKEL